MVNKWLIINTLRNANVVTRTLRDLYIDTDTINAGNLSVTARCHLGCDMDDLLIKCYILGDNMRERIYGSMYYKQELAVFSPSGRVEYVDVALSRWVDGVALSEYICEPSSNFKELSRSFDHMAYSLLSDRVVHCDIKPENIVVNSYGQMTLIDYDALWCKSWGMDYRRELGTLGYRDLKSGQYSPLEDVQNYPIVLISIMLASLALEYNTIYPHIKSGAILNPESPKHFLAAIGCAKDIFMRSGDRTHLALCDIITPSGVNGSNLVDLMYNVVYRRSEDGWQAELGPFYDV